MKNLTQLKIQIQNFKINLNQLNVTFSYKAYFILCDFKNTSLMWH